MIALAGFGGRAQAAAPLRPGDSFDLKLGGIPVEFTQDMAMQYTVAEDGTVKLPYVGVVTAGGLTSTQLSRTLERLFVSAKIYSSPTVSIALPPQSRLVTVGGEVKSPGVVPWSADLTLTAAVSRSGEKSEFTQGAHTSITRNGNTTRYDLRRLARDPKENPLLQPGDEIRVE